MKLTQAQRRVLKRMANQADGREFYYRTLHCRISTLAALVNDGLVFEGRNRSGAPMYSITNAGRKALEAQP